MKAVRLFWWLLPIAALAAPVGAKGLPSGEEVVRRVRAAGSGVRDFTVDITLRVRMEKVSMPDIAVRVFHKRPNKTKLQPLKGFAIIPRGSLPIGDPFARLGEHFAASTVGKDRLAGRPAYQLRLTPREEAGPQTLYAWVDAERWVVLRLRSQTLRGEPMVSDITYQRCQGRYWLPSEIVARAKLPEPGSGPHGRRFGKPGAPPTPGVPGAALRPATITVTFENYRVNTGLPDSLFQEQPKGAQP